MCSNYSQAVVDTPEDTTAQAPPSITRYLQAATTADVKRARAMSSICAMAYNMANLTVSAERTRLGTNRGLLAIYIA